MCQKSAVRGSVHVFALDIIGAIHPLTSESVQVELSSLFEPTLGYNTLSVECKHCQ